MIRYLLVLILCISCSHKSPKKVERDLSSIGREKSCVFEVTELIRSYSSRKEVSKLIEFNNIDLYQKLNKLNKDEIIKTVRSWAEDRRTSPFLHRKVFWIVNQFYMNKSLNDKDVKDLILYLNRWSRGFSEIQFTDKLKLQLSSEIFKHSHTKALSLIEESFLKDSLEVKAKYLSLFKEVKLREYEAIALTEVFDKLPLDEGALDLLEFFILYTRDLREYSFSEMNGDAFGVKGRLYRRLANEKGLTLLDFKKVQAATQLQSTDKKIKKEIEGFLNFKKERALFESRQAEFIVDLEAKYKVPREVLELYQEKMKLIDLQVDEWRVITSNLKSVPHTKEEITELFNFILYSRGYSLAKDGFFINRWMKAISGKFQKNWKVRKGINDIGILFSKGREGEETRFIKRFRRKQAKVKKVYDKEVRDITARVKKEKGLVSNDDLKRVQSYAWKKADIYSNVYYGCRVANKVNVKGMRRHVRLRSVYTLGALSSSTIAYAAVNYNQEKDSKWYGKLFYSQAIALVFGWVNSKFLASSSMGPLKKMVTINSIFAGEDIGISWLYGKIFGAKKMTLDKFKEEMSKDGGEKLFKLFVEFIEKNSPEFKEGTLSPFYTSDSINVKKQLTWSQVKSIGIENIDLERSEELFLESYAAHIYQMEKGALLETGSVGGDIFLFHRIWDWSIGFRHLATFHYMYRFYCSAPTKLSGFARSYGIFMSDSVVSNFLYWYTRKWGIGQ